MRFGGALALVACLFAGAAGADAVDDAVREEMAQQQVPGVTLAVVRHGKVLKAQGYGLANVEHQVPARRETVYQSGSVGKQFTATAVMKLVEFTNLREDVTEAQLLRNIFAMDLVGDPGFARAYSNAGYVVLGVLVARVSGKSYAEFLRERIFAPLEMKTARVPSEADIVANRAAGYQIEKGQLRNQGWVAPAYNSTGDGSLYVTADDLIKWDAALYTQDVLGKESLEQMWTPVKTGSGTISEYGFGWALDGIKGHRRIHHAGSWQGFSAAIERYPDDRLTVIVLMNLGYPGGRAAELASKVARIYLGLPHKP